KLCGLGPAAIQSRRLARITAKDSAEIGRVFKADQRRDLRNALVCLLEQFARLDNPVAVQVFPERYPQLLMENLRQVILADAQRSSDLWPRQRLAVVLVNVCDGIFDQRTGLWGQRLFVEEQVLKCLR